jgi:predicted protein tyrosine phosphatase
MDRSPTAERIYANHPGLEVKSAGVSSYAVTPVSPELLQWADVILTMEAKRDDIFFMSLVREKYPEL